MPHFHSYNSFRLIVNSRVSSILIKAYFFVFHAVHFELTDAIHFAFILSTLLAIRVQLRISSA